MGEWKRLTHKEAVGDVTVVRHYQDSYSLRMAVDDGHETRLTSTPGFGIDLCPAELLALSAKCPEVRALVLGWRDMQTLLQNTAWGDTDAYVNMLDAAAPFQEPADA